jgi:hypothetical protein
VIERSVLVETAAGSITILATLQNPRLFLVVTTITFEYETVSYCMPLS